ncbi:MAG: hypothetical protein U1E62_26905 [Alsobacter sp.]
MSGEPDNFVLQDPRRIDAKPDRLIDDVADLKVRMTAVDEGLAGVHRRMDRFEACLDRVEKPLDLVETPY